MFDFLKQVLKSKTVIFNALIFVAGLLGYLVNDEFVRQYPDVVAILVSVQGALNVVLRFLTSLPISEKTSLTSNRPKGGYKPPIARY